MTNKPKIKAENSQYFEGKLRWCNREQCWCSCCDDDQVEEWISEYFLFHERMKEYIESLWIKTEFAGDVVRFSKCSTKNKECKFLKHSLNKDIDMRPIDCKIFPYAVDWQLIDFDKKIVWLCYWDRTCPIVAKNSIPDDFKEEVKNIIKRDFAVLFYWARFDVRFTNESEENFSPMRNKIVKLRKSLNSFSKKLKKID